MLTKSYLSYSPQNVQMEKNASFHGNNASFYGNSAVLLQLLSARMPCYVCHLASGAKFCLASPRQALPGLCI